MIISLKKILGWKPRQFDQLTSTRCEQTKLPVLASELETYNQQLPEMLRTHRNDFVIIKGCEIHGFYHDRPTAIEAAFCQFRGQPVLVKQVLEHEKIHYVSGINF